ncbi:hypothetical protein KKA15_05410 [Patescibacteria group bacterium]|nr:hypothetical protein [Patescibacteria group bacterium]
MEKSLNEIWHGENYVSVRSLFIKNAEVKNRKLTICDHCIVYKKK